MAEVGKIVKDVEGKENIQQYVKRFAGLDFEKVEKLMGEIRSLNNLKIKEENIVKIADFLPRKNEELNKIITEVNLTEEENKAILEVVKKY